MPCVFWDHLFQYPQQIKDLIALRREADLHARSNIVINIAESDVYIATIDDKCAHVHCDIRMPGCRGKTLCASVHTRLRAPLPPSVINTQSPYECRLMQQASRLRNRCAVLGRDCKECLSIVSWTFTVGWVLAEFSIQSLRRSRLVLLDDTLLRYWSGANAGSRSSWGRDTTWASMRPRRRKAGSSGSLVMTGRSGSRNERQTKQNYRNVVKRAQLQARNHQHDLRQMHKLRSPHDAQLSRSVRKRFIILTDRQLCWSPTVAGPRVQCHDVNLCDAPDNYMAFV